MKKKKSSVNQMVSNDADFFRKGEKVIFESPDYQRIPATVSKSNKGSEVSIKFNRPVKIDAEDQGFSPNRKYKNAKVPDFTLVRKSKMREVS